MEIKSIQPELVYTPDQTAAILQVSKRWLQLDRSTVRTLAYTKVGHFVRYRGKDILDYLDRSRVGGAAA